MLGQGRDGAAGEVDVVHVGVVAGGEEVEAGLLGVECMRDHPFLALGELALADLTSGGEAEDGYSLVDDGEEDG